MEEKWRETFQKIKRRHQTKGHEEPKIRGFIPLCSVLVLLRSSLLLCSAPQGVTWLNFCLSAQITATVDIERPGWCHRKAQGGGSALHCNGGVETNQTYVCQNNQFVFILPAFVSSNQKMLFELKP